MFQEINILEALKILFGAIFYCGFSFWCGVMLTYVILKIKGRIK